MKNKLSPVVTTGLTIIISGLLFGGLGYNIGSNANTTVVATKNYTSDFGFSFEYPSSGSINTMQSVNSIDPKGGDAVQIIAPDFTAHVYVAPVTEVTEESGYFKRSDHQNTFSTEKQLFLPKILRSHWLTINQTLAMLAPMQN